MTWDGRPDRSNLDAVGGSFVGLQRPCPSMALQQLMGLLRLLGTVHLKCRECVATFFHVEHFWWDLPLPSTIQHFGLDCSQFGFFGAVVSEQQFVTANSLWSRPLSHWACSNQFWCHPIHFLHVPSRHQWQPHRSFWKSNLRIKQMPQGGNQKWMSKPPSPTRAAADRCVFVFLITARIFWVDLSVSPNQTLQLTSEQNNKCFFLGSSARMADTSNAFCCSPFSLEYWPNGWVSNSLLAQGLHWTFSSCFGC